MAYDLTHEGVNAFQACLGDGVDRLPETVRRALAPSLQAWGERRGGRYDFAVEVRLPLVGRLVRYEGLLDLA